MCPPWPPALDVDALADAVAAQIVVPAPPAVDVAALADAVVDRIDLDALAMLVAEHLSTSFEVVEEPVPPPPQTKKATPAKRASRRS